jgi:hypothetical protein
MYAVRQLQSDKIISLENVSVISLDLVRNRVVFNFMNNINTVGRWTPDYHYFDYETIEDAIDAFESLISTPYVKLNFFISENAENKEIVNKNAITTITILEDDLRIIFNLNFSITSYDRKRNNNPVEISKFVFWNYDNVDIFEDDSLEINEAFSNTIEI